MTLELDSAHFQSSPLAGIDPRWKLLGFSLAIICTALITKPYSAAAAFLFSFTLFFWACPFPKWRASRLTWVALGLVLFALPAPLLANLPNGQQQRFSLTQEGLVLGILIFLKGMSIACFGLSLAGTQSRQDLIRGLQGLGLSSKISSVFWLFFRYLDLLLEEFKRMRVAMAGKGYRPKNFSQHIWMLSRLSGNLFLRALDHSQHASMAILARGFQGSFRSLAKPKTGRAELGLFLGLSGAFLALLAIDRGLFTP